MSSDNAIGVWKHGEQWFVKEVFMSGDKWNFTGAKGYQTRAEALVAAADMVKSVRMVEYGIVEVQEDDQDVVYKS